MAIKKKRSAPERGPDIMDRARAARAFVDASGNDGDAMAMQSFMGIFHPEVPYPKVREMVEDVRRNRRR